MNYEELCSDKVGSGSALVASICDAVATNGELCAMRFIFLWAIITTNATIHCPFVTRHLVLADDEAGVCAFDIADALEEAAKFICKALLPYGVMGGGFDEMAILPDVPCDVNNNGTNEIDGVQRDR